MPLLHGFQYCNAFCITQDLVSEFAMIFRNIRQGKYVGPLRGRGSWRLRAEQRVESGQSCFMSDVIDPSETGKSMFNSTVKVTPAYDGIKVLFDLVS